MLPEPLCAVLDVRRVRGAEAARSFLRPLLAHLHSPDLLPDAGVAAERVVAAIRGGERIFVHGDYDVDGISAAALLTRWLTRLGGRVVPFVPHRLRDGYDFGSAGLEAAGKAGARLVITADSGVLALDTVARARRAGIDVIVTDHHTPGPTLPDAVAVVNPMRPDSAYPGRELCGAGIAFKLCQIVGELMGAPRDALLSHLDLVALATVADLVPLVGENRILVRYGLRALSQTQNPGLRALLDVTGLAEKTIDAGRVGFVLAPRINAAGRIDDSMVALRLLLTDDPSEARELAARLDRVNELRQEEDRRTLGEALDVLAADYAPERDFGLVLAGEGWHPGVIGIVASRVVERVHRPTVMLSLGDGTARGSARSIPGFHLFEALSACARHLIRFGGHRQAAGMDLAREEVEAFRQSFNEEARARLGGVEPRPTLTADLDLRLADVSADLVRFLPYVGPFGIGNGRPVFLARGVRLEGPPRVVGNGHLKTVLVDGDVRLSAIGFGLGRRLPPAALDVERSDVMFQLTENHYRGLVTVEARLLDVRPSRGDGAGTGEPR